jgi:hypothetical protein
MRRTLLLIAALLVASLLLWVYTSTTCILWHANFELTVHVSSDPGPPRSVSCQAMGRRDDAVTVLQHLAPPETKLWSATAEPFDGKPLVVNVPVGGRESMSGRELKRYQFRYLVVIAVLADGRRVGKLVEIPDSRESREISVELQ